jgi:hypothetical protein
MAASTERTVPSVNSFTLPDTLTAVLLASRPPSERQESADAGPGNAWAVTLPMVSSNAYPSKGFGRYPAAPDRLARWRVGASSRAVMKMMGMAAR